MIRNKNESIFISSSKDEIKGTKTIALARPLKHGCFEQGKCPCFIESLILKGNHPVNEKEMANLIFVKI